VGPNSKTAKEPQVAKAQRCRRDGAREHGGAAYAGAAAIVPELRPMFQGMELADSIVFNPHKWLLTNFDCTAYFVRDPAALLGTFQATPEYLRTSYDADVVNFRDWGIQLGRRFRALKLWFVIRSYGVEGLRAIIRRHVALAGELARRIDQEPEFEVMAPVPFGLVCFRWCPAGRSEEELDALNARLLAAVNAGRERYLTHTRLGGRYAIRLVVGQRGTEREHVSAAWDGVRSAAEGLR
jgi:aromatic-L-amino-acid decarboxylase